MADHHTLSTVDRDGALQEAIAGVEGDTRADALRKAALATGGLVGGAGVLALLTPGVAGAQTRGDVAIANFALLLEELEAAFYVEAVANNILTGRPLELVTKIRDHETTHVRVLRETLGDAAIPRPAFNFQGTTQDVARFLDTAVTLEDTGVAAYKGAAPAIRSRAILAAALSIHSVEARHAAVVRRLNQNRPVIATFDRPLTVAQVTRRVEATGFIVTDED
jgi:rubrerythrin